jgi:hypothetical protein
MDVAGEVVPRDGFVGEAAPRLSVLHPFFTVRTLSFDTEA